MRITTRSFPLVLLFVASFLLGCGGSTRPKLVKATGTVFLDGKPLDSAAVTFSLVEVKDKKFQRPSQGVTDSSGVFKLGTYGADDGIPIGKYKVTIMRKDLVGTLPADYNPDNADAYQLTYSWITPKEFSDPASSPLTAEVTSAGLKPEKFELKSNGPPEQEGPAARRGNIP